MADKSKILKDILINYKHLNDTPAILNKIASLLNLSIFSYKDTITISSSSFVIDIPSFIVEDKYDSNKHNIKSRAPSSVDKSASVLSSINDESRKNIKIQFVNEAHNLTYLYTIKYFEFAFFNKDYLLFYGLLKSLVYENKCEKRALKYLNGNLYCCTCLYTVIPNINDKIKGQGFSDMNNKKKTGLSIFTEERNIHEIIKERDYDENTAINIFNHLPLNTKILRTEHGEIHSKKFVIKNNKFFLDGEEVKRLSILVKRGISTLDILKFI
ncbi:hypothetical protein CDIK_2125 [Cucumispora dikerogammari]|nr:hypothetical protein CDIK_2125 [Cucumispora dikerogammari]